MTQLDLESWRKRFCQKPDRDVSALVCGHPIPCPYHTMSIDLATGTVTAPPEASTAAVVKTRAIARALTRPPIDTRPSIEVRFEEFDKANPHVLVEMLRLARIKLAAGARRIGAKALWEELRESIRVRALGNWKLDNSLTALYARKLIELDGSLAGVIETRKRKIRG